jgi:hypothetical protein
MALHIPEPCIFSFHHKNLKSQKEIISSTLPNKCMLKFLAIRMSMKIKEDGANT